MFIVHGTDKADALKVKYTVLELDTIKYPEDPTNPVTMYTVIDTGKLSLESMSSLEQFGGQVDSFYDHVSERLGNA
jgi:hypothetical protein